MPPPHTAAPAMLLSSETAPLLRRQSRRQPIPSPMMAPSAAMKAVMLSSRRRNAFRRALLAVWQQRWLLSSRNYRPSRRQGDLSAWAQIRRSKEKRRHRLHICFKIMYPSLSPQPPFHTLLFLRTRRLSGKKERKESARNFD